MLTGLFTIWNIQLYLLKLALHYFNQISEFYFTEWCTIIPSARGKDKNMGNDWTCYCHFASHHWIYMLASHLVTMGSLKTVIWFAKY